MDNKKIIPIKLSNRSLKLNFSPIRKLAPLAEDARKNNIKIYHLNIGQPDIKLDDKVRSKLKNIDLDILSYSRSNGRETLIKKICAYYKNNGIQVEESDIIVTIGGSEAILFTLSVICDSDDEVLIPEPFYTNYKSFCKILGINITPITSKIEDNFQLPPIEKIENLISTKTKAILICNPSNPTGYVYKKEELLKLRDIAIKKNVFIVCDEVYREFVYDDNEQTSILNLDGLDNHAIVIDSVSKRYSMCGARIGNIASRNKVFLDNVLKLCQARLSPPLLSEILAETAFDIDKSYFDKIIKEYKKRRDIVINGLKSIPNVLYNEPKGAFYCIAQLPVDDAEEFSKWLLKHFNIDGETVMLAPLSDFYINKEHGKNQVRIAYVLNKEDLSKAMIIIKEAIESYPNKTL